MRRQKQQCTRNNCVEFNENFDILRKWLHLLLRVKQMLGKYWWLWRIFIMFFIVEILYVGTKESTHLNYQKSSLRKKRAGVVIKAIFLDIDGVLVMLTKFSPANKCKYIALCWLYISTYYLFIYYLLWSLLITDITGNVIKFTDCKRNRHTLPVRLSIVSGGHSF